MKNLLKSYYYVDKSDFGIGALVTILILCIVGIPCGEHYTDFGIDLYTILMGTTLIATILPTIAYILASVGGKLWAYIDDEEKHTNIIYDYFVKHRISPAKVVLLFALLPFTLYLVVTLYNITLILIIVGVVVYLARFTRRLFKRFNLHEKDPNAHN